MNTKRIPVYSEGAYKNLSSGIFNGDERIWYIDVPFNIKDTYLLHTDNRIEWFLDYETMQWYEDMQWGFPLDAPIYSPRYINHNQEG